MSLINDALKRAEEDKVRNPATDFGTQPLPPVRRRRRGKSLAVRALSVVIALCLFGAGWTAWQILRVATETGPREATGGEPRAQLIPAPETASGTPEAPESAAAKPTTRPALVHRIGAEVGRQFLQTLEALRNAPPPAVRPQPEAAEPPAEKAEPPEPEPEPKTRKPPPPVRPQVLRVPHLSLQGVMGGSHGRFTAIINGNFVQVGDTVEGATVVEITEQTATLEFRGKRLRLKM